MAALLLSSRLHIGASPKPPLRLLPRHDRQGLPPPGPPTCLLRDAAGGDLPGRGAALPLPGPLEITVLVTGATGYIGAALLADLSQYGPVHAAVCCLASRGGGVQDSWRVDYRATLHTLQASRSLGAAHFVLLSAVCVQKPLLEFQRAKLKFEDELAAEAARDPAFTYSIVRPTAFFKSLGGQVETVKKGQPYVMFGDGKLCACKPISEEDLAAFIADCIFDQDKANKVLPIGGPGKALTPLEQGEMLFRLLGREPKFIKVPIQIMDGVIWVLDGLAKVFPGLEDAAEFGKIGRYYASESMLVLDPETREYSDEKTPSYGKDTLEQFFDKVTREGMAGQELGEQTIF